ncbi:MAG TPA: class IV lanthionine synthetase LanL [Actinopolymorphaceae bacterium]|nr:class IV lanthionine synthetase LanL [Actinopolymorphaceae bacterium]
MTTVPPARLDDDPGELVHAVAEMLGCQVEAPSRVQPRHENGTGASTTWGLEAGPVWQLARPTGHVQRSQGWQLHLSATPRTVGAMLERVVPVLRAERLAFAFAPGVDVVRWLATDACGYADFGKVLTVWPHDDAGFARLAERLHRATIGLVGPRVLSARAYQPGSTVHYRYGVFAQSADASSLDDDGCLDNDGRVVNDGATPSGARPTPPSVSVPPAHTDEPGRPVRWDGRYVVHATLRHGAAVAVHLASDEQAASTSTDVVLRHARAHANPQPDGSDARNRLVAEAHLQRRLSGRLRTPRPLRVFAAGGDVVLVEECVTGVPLRQWIRRQSSTGAGLPPMAALRLARRLCSLVGAAHREGVVLRNLNPAHLVVAADATPALVDLSDAAGLGATTSYRSEPGYQAPELRLTGTAPVPAEPSADLYSLGALLFLVATGNDPVVAADDPPHSRPDRDRLAGWLTLVGRYDETSRLLRPAIMTMMAESPSERGDLGQVQELLATDRSGVPAPLPARLPASQPTGEELLADGLAHLAATMSPDGSRLWPSGPSGARTDARNIQHGAAGVLAVLLRAYADGAPTGTSQAALEASVRKAASWLSHHCERGGPPLPGLYFGRSGVAWVLADAAAALDEPQLLAQAEHLAQQLPTSWPNPDVAHGLAGAALTQLHLARLTSDPGGRRHPGTPERTRSWSGDGRFLARAAVYAEALRRAAVSGPYGPTWPIPRGFASKLAGACHYGFAHGVAGIGYSLLALGSALDDSAYTTLAVEAGYTLCRAARIDDDGAAWWPVGPADRTRLPHWCSGSSGVGTFLLRLCAVAGEQRCGEYARAAAGAVHRARWASPPSACHGLAGDGQFLLDAADLLADPTYRAWAEDLVPLLAVRHCRRDGRALVPDETLRSVVADYNVGLAGVLAYLLRLRHGGPRLFHVDELLFEDAGLHMAPEAASVR